MRKGKFKSKIKVCFIYSCCYTVTGFITEMLKITIMKHFQFCLLYSNFYAVFWKWTQFYYGRSVQFSVLVTSGVYLQICSVKLPVILVPSTRISIWCVVAWIKNIVICPWLCLVVQYVACMPGERWGWLNWVPASMFTRD